MGVTLSAGHSLSWFKENFAENDTFEELLADLKMSQSAQTAFYLPLT